MEHRIGIRKKVNATVELWQVDFKRGDFELVNIGIGGLFLKGSDAGVHEGEIFTVKSTAGQQAEITFDSSLVMVVHRSKDGFGLMWAGCDSLFFSRLSNVLGQAA